MISVLLSLNKQAASSAAITFVSEISMAAYVTFKTRVYLPFDDPLPDRSVQVVLPVQSGSPVPFAKRTAYSVRPNRPAIQ